MSATGEKQATPPLGRRTVVAVSACVVFQIESMFDFIPRVARPPTLINPAREKGS